jgi:hypothetical protein
MVDGKEYKEVLPGHGRKGLALAGFGLFLAGGSVLMLIIAPELRKTFRLWVAAYACLSMSVMAILGLLSLRRFHIHVSGGLLRFGYRPRLMTIPARDIDWIAREELSVAVHSGAAARTQARGVIHRSGSGVRIHLHGSLRDWIIPTDNPQRLAVALGKTLLPKHPAPPPSLTAPPAEPEVYEYAEEHKPGRKESVAVVAAMAAVMLLIHILAHDSGRWISGVVLLAGALLLARVHMGVHPTAVRIANRRLWLTDHIGFKHSFAADEIEWMAEDRLRTLRDGILTFWRRRGVRCWANTAGRAILMRVRDEAKPYLFRVNDPEAVARALGKELLPEPPAGSRI